MGKIIGRFVLSCLTKHVNIGTKKINLSLKFIYLFALYASKQIINPQNQFNNEET